MVSVIIPAFNEEQTIEKVVMTAVSHPLVDEVIVVDDGSYDKTASVAGCAGATVIVHRTNKGKASAMETGIKKSSHDIIFFIDGDIIGLTHEAMNEAINSVREHASQMYVLVVDRDKLVPQNIQKYLPLIGGVRVIRRTIWNAIPNECKNHFQIELALNYFARKMEASIAWRVIPNLTHRVKENKRGIVWGLYQRIFMIRDIVLISTKLYIVYPIEQYIISAFNLSKQNKF